jgi:hypothetical protein
MPQDGNRSKELAVPPLGAEPSPEPAAAETGAGTTPAAGREGPGWRRATAGLRRVIRDNPLFSIALALAVVPRVIVMLGWLPAVLFRLDTFDYLWNAVHVAPNPVNPSGYSLFLFVLRPFHSLELVAALQHVMGLAIAVMVYALLRSWRVSRWLATVAALPVLFDPGQMLLEHLIMADILALFLMVAGFTLVLYRGSSAVPPVWRVVLGGLAMGGSVIARPTALPLIVFMAIYLLVVRAGWRKAGAVLVAGAIPVVAYMSWFASVYGSFNMTNSDGLFLWSRTMSFANCSVIKPPADLQALCPTSQPPPFNQAVASKRPAPRWYLWDHNAWQWQPPSTALVPDTQAFSKANNSRAMRFAIKAITAQPLAFADVVTREALSPLVHTNAFRFPTRPEAAGMGAANARYARAAVRAYTGSDSVPFLGWHYSSNERQPYAHLMADYQRVIFLPAPVFTLILLIGLAGFFIPRRRSAAAILLWVSAVVILVLPVAEHEYTYRYVIPAVPLACMAAALAFRQLGGAGEQRARQQGDVEQRAGQQVDGQQGDGQQGDAERRDNGERPDGGQTPETAGSGPSETGPSGAEPEPA